MPSPEMLGIIADRCCVSVDYLLGREPPALASERESAPQTPPPAPSTSHQAPSTLCRYPANCDLAGKLASLEGQMDEIRTLLISLLAEERRRNNPPNSTEKVGEKVG